MPCLISHRYRHCQCTQEIPKTESYIFPLLEWSCDLAVCSFTRCVDCDLTFWRRTSQEMSAIQHDQVYRGHMRLEVDFNGSLKVMMLPRMNRISNMAIRVTRMTCQCIVHMLSRVRNGHSEDFCEEKENQMTMCEDIQGLVSARCRLLQFDCPGRSELYLLICSL